MPQHEVTMLPEQAEEGILLPQTALPLGQGAVDHCPSLAVVIGDRARVLGGPSAMALKVDIGPSEDQSDAEPGRRFGVAHPPHFGQQPRQ